MASCEVNAIHNWIKPILRRWWDNSNNYMQKQSTPLGEAVQEILRSQEKESPFPPGMDANWALDVQSAQGGNSIA